MNFVAGVKQILSQKRCAATMVAVLAVVPADTTGDCHANSKWPQYKMGRVMCVWNAKSTPGTGQGSNVLCRRVRTTPFFRCLRFGASEIRNVASCSHRACVSKRIGEGAWFLADDLVSSAKAIHEGWDGGSASTNSGAKARLQTQQYTHCSGASAAGRNPRHSDPTPARNGEQAFWHLCTRAQFESRIAYTRTPKKTLIAPNSELERQYELLRQQTLQPDTLSNALGLAVLIRKGMAAWINALTEQFLSSAIRPIHSDSTANALIDVGRQEWILALTALALGGHYVELDPNINSVGGVL